MVHSEWWLPRVETEAFNTTCAVYGEDYECWWLSGGDSSVVRALAAQVRGPGFDSRQASFSLFSPSPQNKPPVFTHTQSNISYTSIATKNVVDSSVQLNGYVRCTTYSKVFVFFFTVVAVTWYKLHMSVLSGDHKVDKAFLCRWLQHGRTMHH